MTTLERIAAAFGVTAEAFLERAAFAGDPPALLDEGGEVVELHLDRIPARAFPESPTELVFEDCPALVRLSVGGRGLRRLAVRRAPRLVELDCADNPLDALDLAVVPRLRRLVCSGSPVASLVLPAGLVRLECERTRLSRLDLTAAPGLAEGRFPPGVEIVATPLQRARIPALREHFGLRAVPTRVEDMDLFELHLVAERLNRDEGVERLRRMAASWALDRGTALMLYWRSHPAFFLAWSDRRDVPGHARDEWDLLQALEKRLLADEFVTRDIPFDPRDDTCHPCIGTDWTQDAVKPHPRSIPEALFAPCEGLAEAYQEALYEVEGYFDKDAQGWCASMHRVRVFGDRVAFERWFDENGHTTVHERHEGRIVARDGDRLTVRFADHERALDRTTGRFLGPW